MPRLGPGTRAQIGANVLAAAAVADMRAVREPLAEFAAVHRQYIEAQETLRGLERHLAAAQRQLDDRDRVLRTSIEDLARALMMTGQPRLSPFRGLGSPSPAVLQRFAMTKKAKAVRQLGVAVQRMRSVPSTVLDAGSAAAAAADNVEAAIQALLAPEAALRGARMTRDVIGQRWDRKLAGLRLFAQAARDEGAPYLYSMLFNAVDRIPSLNRRKRAAPR